MKKTILLSQLYFICYLSLHAQAVYVDCNSGDDENPGTKEAPLYSIHKAAELIKINDNTTYSVKINPGIYVLDSTLKISTSKDITDKRIVFEACILPDDTSWSPEKMPVILSRSGKGEIPEFYNLVAAFLVDASHVTIRGLKFNGYSYPNSRYFPIARFNKEKTDLQVEQCMFVGDEHASHIQVGVISHGNGVNISHCIFYNAKNAVVFWEDSGDTLKTGNRFTNCIVYGAFQTAIWTSWPDKDFVFENNIITNCKHAWIKNYFNESKYTLSNCIMVNNQYYQAIADNSGVNPKDFDIIENHVIKEGEVTLRLIDWIDSPLPKDYLHVFPNTLGYNLHAGLFKN